MIRVRAEAARSTNTAAEDKQKQNIVRESTEKSG